ASPPVPGPGAAGTPSRAPRRRPTRWAPRRSGSWLPRRPRYDAELVHLRFEDVRRFGRRTATGLQLVAQFLKFRTAGHQPGQLVPGDLVLLVVPEHPAALEE